MPWIGPITAITLIAATLIAWFHAIYVWRNRTGQPASGFILTMILTGFWALTSAAVSLSGSGPQAYFWMRITSGLIAYIAVGILVTCAQYAGFATLSRRDVVGLLLILPTITMGISLTSNQHTLYMYDVVFYTQGAQITTFTAENGPWFLVHTIYSYSLVLIGLLMLLQYIATVRFTAYRTQAALLLVGLLLPIVASILNTLVSQVHTFMSQMVAIISAPIIFWALFRYRLFSLQPIAREQAFEEMDDAIFVLDAEHRLIDVNPAGERFLTSVNDDIIGRPIDEIFKNGPLGAELWQDTNQSHRQIEVGSGDQRRSYDLRITPFNRNGVYVGQLIVVRDRTEQQHAEAEARHREIERERVRTLSEFVTNASHEFRTPLSVIKTSIYLMHRDGLSEPHAKRMVQIDGQADRIAALVDDLLAVVRLEQRATLELAPNDINTIVREVTTRLNDELTAKNLDLKFELADSIVPVLSDAIYLADALYEITDNAVRYTSPGGSIKISTKGNGDCVYIDIADTGIGITSEHLPHIFDVFYRADSAHTLSGFGVGLAIARRIVHLHGGTIYATSIPGSGTTVHIALPIPQLQPGPSAPQPAHP